LIARYAVPAFEVESVNGYEQRISGWAEALRRRPWVESISVNENSARVVVKDIETAQRELMGSIVRAGLALARYEMVRPSLEDVFLRLVGEGGPA
jgi:ABC-2 type transport system ATP-binding protein